MIERMLNTLVDCGLIVETQGKSAGYVPARTSEHISLWEVLNCARLAEDAGMNDQLTTSSEIDRLRGDIDDLLEQTLQQRTLKDLITPTA